MAIYSYMYCPYCYHPETDVTNSRVTKSNTQVWRRRKCLKCKSIFTTHEIIDLSHIVVIKKSGKTQSFSRIKLYSGIYGSTIGSKTPHREYLVDKITREVEKDILFLKKKRVSSSQISDIVLYKLRKMHPTSFMRFLSYSKDISSEDQMKKEFKKYTAK
jgi:transcriptional repressor NrdR